MSVSFSETCKKRTEKSVKYAEKNQPSLKRSFYFNLVYSA